jgi:hypothetical protein
MIITAKFASVCPCCSSRIAVGAKVEWNRGEKAKHVACGGAVQAAAATAAPAARTMVVGAAPARRARKGTWTGCSCGSVEEYSKDSDCWTCRHDAE